MASVLPSAHEFQSNFHWQYIVHPLHYLTFAVGRKDGTILIDSAENAGIDNDLHGHVCRYHHILTIGWM